MPCLKTPCAVCPPGESRNGKGVCVPPVVANPVCQTGQFWNGAACAVNAECQYGTVWDGFACRARYFVDDCSSLAVELEQQEQRMRSAVMAQQESCSHDSAGQECAGLREQSAGENLRYRQLQEQYDQCREHRRASFRFRGTSLPGSSWVLREDY